MTERFGLWWCLWGAPTCSRFAVIEKMGDTEIIFVVEESTEGGFEARALGYSIFTEGDTMDELKVMLRDAVHCHFDDEARPRVIRLHQVKDEVIAV